MSNNTQDQEIEHILLLAQERFSVAERVFDETVEQMLLAIGVDDVAGMETAPPLLREIFNNATNPAWEIMEELRYALERAQFAADAVREMACVTAEVRPVWARLPSAT